ncbi:MAG: AbrB/MazE/SpoVT family DNA-binding domain-containing protein [Candidatus Saccharibacteria bacterium]|nr:AbrB/MazE/SpoVT family DNA-binding domain-containing protein [Candidatus Saccharibacteria bacterium]
MRTKIVRIGNSKGIRIPKAILEQTNLGDKVLLEVSNNTIVIKSDIGFEGMSAREMALLSEATLSDWNNPEEDEAWAHLQ